MGAFAADRERQAPKEHQWDYFNLSDFKSNSCWAGFSYGILYISLVISIACYILDILTCSQLIIANRWEGQISTSPIIKFEIARWIFTGCILLSFVLLGYRWWKAIRAIKSGSVAASYLDPLAVRVQSIRMGQGQGWRRFLVFAELTKSKKGAEYVALFSYFSFEAAIRIIFAEGPRQVINGLTIYTVMTSEIIPLNGTKLAAPTGHSPFVQFFLNVKVLAEGNTLRAIVFFGMLFTLLVWIIAALSLASACLMYVVFLWHHIPAGDGGLRGYCKRKVDGKLQSIVDAKIKKAMQREEKMRVKAEAKAVKTGQPIQGIKKQPTLPILTGSDDKLPDMPTISRQPTFSTLPEYESRPATPSSRGQPGYAENFSRPGMPMRSATQATTCSYTSSNAPLMGTAAPMGFSQTPRPYSPAQMSQASTLIGGPPPLGRSLTGQSEASHISQNSQGSYGYGQRPPNQMRPMGPPARQNTGGSQLGPDRQFSQAPSMRSNTPVGELSFNPGPPVRQNTGGSQFGPERQFIPASSMRSNTPMGEPTFNPGPPRRTNTGESNGGYFGAPDRSDAGSVMSNQSGFNRRAPGPQGSRGHEEQGIEMQHRHQPPTMQSNQTFRPYSPALSAPDRAPRIPFSGPPTNFSSHVGHASSSSFDRPYTPPQRIGTAPLQNHYPSSSMSSQNGRPGPPGRSMTAGPSYEEWPQHGL